MQIKQISDDEISKGKKCADLAIFSPIIVEFTGNFGISTRMYGSTLQ